MKLTRFRARLAAAGTVAIAVTSTAIGITPTAADAATNACSNPVLATRTCLVDLVG